MYPYYLKIPACISLILIIFLIPGHSYSQDTVIKLAITSSTAYLYYKQTGD